MREYIFSGRIMHSGGVNHSASNIFSNSSAMTSRMRSSTGNTSEAGMRGLSRKDRDSVTNIEKDALEYEMREGMENMSDSFDNDEWERISDMFS